jgi:hypothetical protein
MTLGQQVIGSASDRTASGTSSGTWKKLPGARRGRIASSHLRPVPPETGPHRRPASPATGPAARALARPAARPGSEARDRRLTRGLVTQCHKAIVANSPPTSAIRTAHSMDDRRSAPDRRPPSRRAAPARARTCVRRRRAAGTRTQGARARARPAELRARAQAARCRTIRAPARPRAHHGDRRGRGPSRVRVRAWNVTPRRHAGRTPPPALRRPSDTVSQGVPVPRRLSAPARGAVSG